MMVVAKLDIQTPDYKVALFLHCIGVEGWKIANGFQVDRPEDRNDTTKVIQKFNQFTISELDETFEMYYVNSRNQQSKNPWMLMSPPSACAKSGHFIARDGIILDI